jgi:hypothetical protein
VPTGNLYYIAGSFGNPEIVNVVSDQEVFDCPDLYSTREGGHRMILQASHADKRRTNREEHEIATSLSGSPKLAKSWKSGAFSILYTDRRSLVHPPIITLTSFK